MALVADHIRYVATLARLTLTDEEVTRFAGQLDQILAYVDTLKQLKTDDVPPTSHAVPMSNVFRRDEPAPALPIEAALANAPQREGPFFKVPRVLDDA
ncbi:MAG: asparaginyl/glutamyl-tRNA amidotransferase subunit C [Omnitrophica WOR_2 bacterium RIFCSPHIGHO2_02_FULL_68_15]|nr:MAG: asparaginyl/glutamyl-tRNA amidotransferase subunit C [Omnitrophica WOR_2 bacterium RIFCSPHIGHO2_02_FULL_68_15]